MSETTSTVVSVIVVTYNSADVLPDLLGSLADAAEHNSVEVVVVDNASAEAAPTEAIALAHGARFVGLERNIGYGGGVNAGAAESSGEFLLVCNADLRLGPNAIDTLVDFARANPDAGSLGPAILDPDGSVYPSARRSPSIRHGVGHALLGGIAPDNRWSAEYRRTGAPLITRDTDWLSGACLFLPRSVFDTVSGFDEGYFMYFEDVDLGDRIRATGRRNVYVPAAQVMHTGGHSTAGESQRMIAEHHRSAYRYLSRRYRGVWLWPVRVVLRAGLAVRLAWATRGVRRTADRPHTRSAGRAR